MEDHVTMEAWECASGDAPAPVGDTVAPQTDPSEMSETLRTERRRLAQERELAAFIRAFPDVNANDIPPQVWEAVRNGESLLDAYRRFEFQQLRRDNRLLRERLEREAWSRRNRERSAGSQRSAGSTRALSEWERAWYDE